MTEQVGQGKAAESGQAEAEEFPATQGAGTGRRRFHDVPPASAGAGSLYRTPGGRRKVFADGNCYRYSSVGVASRSSPANRPRRYDSTAIAAIAALSVQRLI